MVAPEAPGDQEQLPGFRVALANFTGPFDLLLQLIGKKKLDVTEVALARVTDDFIAYTRELGDTADLDEITEFLVIAATLLDLKTARLLPRGEVDSEEDLALLESRDLLFARLLQYKAYKQVADLFSHWQAGAPRRYARAVGPEQQFADLLPPVSLGHTPDSFAEVAAGVFRPRPTEVVGTGHIHVQKVSVPEQAGKILTALRLAGPGSWLSFAALVCDCETHIHVVGRFLALLELYKAQAVDARQEQSLGPLSLAWTGREVDPAVVAAGTWE
ncbi:segregation and condensation protein A [Corynebacterium mendelii]|uniref:Segregation and condensation protein A n=1 Tax=Corynebacterium mendelii TaxID=2765362 RepID=A0A939IT85_9CORY|nr:segregation/condensation protein A [Corynebacterium mendelii]